MSVWRMKPSGTVVVGVVALVIGLEAPAMAHQVNAVAHRISGSSIKPHSIAGNRLKHNTVTGAQIKESTLGTVPKAKSAKTAKELAPLAWHHLKLENGWKSYGRPAERAPAYAVDAQGVVHFRGAFKGGVDNTTVFTLPPGVEPKGLDITLPVLCGSTGEDCYLNAETDGVSVADSAGAVSGSSTNYVSLEGVTFDGK